MKSDALVQPPNAATTSLPLPDSGISIGGLVRRPEVGSLIGMIAVLAFFSTFGGANFLSAGGAASWLNVASELGIIALPVGLLMIAGHLDLSVGSMVPASSMTIAIISGHYGLPIIVGILAALGLGLSVGFINGLLVIRTKVPSFVVTLATLFALAGLTLGLSVILTGSTSVALRSGPVAKLLLGDYVGGKFEVTLFWWIAAVLIVGFILNFSRYGNWILAMGGDSVSARNAGIPTDRLTIALFEQWCAPRRPVAGDPQPTRTGVRRASFINSIAGVVWRRVRDRRLRGSVAASCSADSPSLTGHLLHWLLTPTGRAHHRRPLLLGCA